MKKYHCAQSGDCRHKEHPLASIATAMIFLGTAVVYLLELRPAHPPNENNEV